MQFNSIDGSDARLVELDVRGDSRGQFARVWCRRMFSEAGLEFEPIQGNTSLTKLRGSVRGMHFQKWPRADAKVVRCSHGRIHDVIIDLREGSPTCGRAYHLELGEDSASMLFVPAGFAHGFQTLTDDVIVEYLMGTEYVADLYDGARFDDPLLAVQWPEPITELSEKDKAWPDLADRMPWLVDGAR
jgi:dTDP-4-dehydrorhamnose 3,5-epimerase